MNKAFYIACYFFVIVLLFLIGFGSNGFFDAWRLRKEHESLNAYLGYLKTEQTRLKQYASHLEDAEDIKNELANDLGFFKTNSKSLIKIENNDSRVSLNIGESNTYLNEYVKVTSEVERIQNIKNIFMSMFLLLSLLFGFLIVFGISE